MRHGLPFLNGVGRVGKSSIAKALQAITTEPFLRIAMNASIDMLPKGMIGHPGDGIIFEAARIRTSQLLPSRPGR